MKAMVNGPGGIAGIRATDVPDPGQPGSGEIRVRMHASSVNYHDHGVAAGHMGVAPGRILMADGAGVVEAVGTDVAEFAVGDAVVSCFFPDWRGGPPPRADFARTPGDGIDGYAREVVVTPAGWFTRAPHGFSHVEAATITTAGVTAWRALVAIGGIKAGDTVLTLGTGGVSIWALQIARLMGASVIATSSSDAKLRRLEAMGAAHVVNYKATPDWGRHVAELTGGRGVDHVVEVGGPATLAQSIAAARIGGNISLIGVLTGISGEVPTVALMAKQIVLSGLIVGSRRHQQDLVRALDGGAVRPVIDRTFPLAALAEAFAYEESGRHFGKIAIKI